MGSIGNPNSQLPPTLPPPTPIAITGLSFRLPGDVKTEEEFWRFCCKAQSGWSEIPPDRFTAGGYYHRNPDRLGAFTPKGGYFLREDVGRFDASFFGITAEEARSMDPQQRLMLECAYEALERAGASRVLLEGQKVGVFAGGTNSDYEHHASRDAEQIPRYNVAGTAASFLANRLSHFFDFTGPSFTVDTACSSSLTALHVACQSLRQGESTHALVGSCHLNLDPDWFISFSSSSLLSSSGKCHSFDHQATSGYGRGEGAGCVFLRPLDAALAAGDNILAVIANTGINQDGHTPGISLPSSTAQERLIRSVYESAGINPQETAYVEAHGTGTKVGDPLEAQALYACFRRDKLDRSPRSPLYIGSVKSNFGHAEGASGMISLVKTVLMLQRGFILPNGGFERPRDDIPWEEWNLKVPRKLMPWPTGKPYASINNFGLGGANAHVVLRKAPSQLPSPMLMSPRHQGQKNLRLLYLLSANSEEAVTTQAKNLEVYLERNPSAYDPHLMYNLAYTLGERRTLLPWKIAVSAQSAQELLTALSAKETRPCRSIQPPKLAFVFTGQGAHWHAMGRELLATYPVFRDILGQADQYLNRLCAGFSLVEELLRDKERSRLSLPHISQSACTAIQLALTALLWSWNITPKLVIGHSSGEIAAAYAAGILSLEDAMQISYERGMAALALQADFPKVKGAMMAIGASAEAVQILIQDIRGCISIACINSGQNVTVSGDEAAINTLAELVATQGLFHRRLNVNVAYHSSHINLVADSYLARIGNIQPRSSRVPFYSSARGKLIGASELGAAYWIENLVSCVQFAPTLKKALDTEQTGGSQIDLLIEVGPHAALASAIVEILQSSGHHTSTAYLSTLRRNTDATKTMHNLAAALILQGQRLDFDALNPLRPHGVMPSVIRDLPRYPWDHHTRYWHSTRLGHNHLFKHFARHDLLGSLSIESDDLEPRWRTIIRLEDHPWIKDHRVQGRATFPMTAFLAMAIEAARQCAVLRKTEFDTFNLREVCLGKMLVVPDSTAVEIATSLRPLSEGTRTSSSTWYEVRILSWVEQRGWDENFRGLISTQRRPAENPITGRSHRDKSAQQMRNLAKIQTSCTEVISSESLYQDLEGRGFQYDRIFRNAASYLTNKREAVATIHTPSSVDDEVVASGLPEGRMQLHPAVLDLFVHSLWPTFGAGTKDGLPTLYVPSYVKGLVVSKNLDIRPGDEYSSFARRVGPLTLDRPVVGNIWVTRSQPAEAEVLFQWEGLAMTPIHGQEARSEGKRESFFRVQMEPCVDFMSPPSVQRGFKSANEPHPLDQVAYEFAHKAISQPPTDLPSGLKRFYRGLVERVGSTCRPTLCHEIRDHARSQPGENKSQQMLHDFGACLPDLLCGRAEINTLSQKYGSLDSFYSDVTLCHPIYRQTATCLSAMWSQKPNLRVLEIGTSLVATVQIFASLHKEPQFREYVFANVSELEIPEQRGKSLLGKWSEHVQIRTVNISEDFTMQGLQPDSVDLVLVSNLSLPDGHISQVLACTRKLLGNGGKLVLVGTEDNSPLRDFPVALMTGGWPEDHQGVTLQNKIVPNEWDRLLRNSGFTGVDLLLDDGGKVMVSSTASPSRQNQQVVIIHNDDLAASWLAGLAQAVQSAIGIPPVIQSMPETTAAGLEGNICLFLGELTSPILPTMSQGPFNTIKTLIQAASGILWITRDAYIRSKNPGANLISGFARTVRSELGIPIATLDLSAETTPAEEPRTIASVLKTVFVHPSVLCSGDFEFAYRDGIVSVPRVIPDPVFADAVSRTTAESAHELQPVRQPERPLRLQIQDYGILDSLYFTDTTADTALPPDWIEIEVRCVGLNFRDIMHANNQIPVDGFGVECSGVVTAVGPSVDSSLRLRLRVGDRVCAMADCCFATRTRCPAACAWTIGPEMSFEVAASIPVVFTTAIYSLNTIGRLLPGEKILIHAAAGGVGQAAIMVAQAAGAEIFATVGSPRKKELLVQRYGIPEDRIFYSRDLSFAEDIMESTGGAGVDVVLNSLAGEYLQASLECVAPFGRFVEIGKRDISLNSRLEMARFAYNVSFSAVDLSVFGRDRPGLLKRLMAETFQLLESGRVRPIGPLNVFDVWEVGAAFQALQSGQSMGKVVVRFEDASRVNVIPACPRDVPFLQGNATYMVIGGTGGLGKSITNWLAKQGATSILLVSRSGWEGPGVRNLVDGMAVKDVAVSVLRCDVSDRMQVQTILVPYLQQRPPVRGVIHSAMVLRDAAFENMTWTDYTAVLKPKVAGVYHLHELYTQLEFPLDFFIALSSVAGIVGNQGQSAYAAANTFLDAFSQYSQVQGRPFTSIDLAAMRDVGYLAEDTQKRGRVEELLGQDAGMDEVDLHHLLTGAVHPRSGSSPNAHIVTGLQRIPVDTAPQTPFWAGDARFSYLLDYTTTAPTTTGTNTGEVSLQTAGEKLKRVQRLEDAQEIVVQALAHKIAAVVICPAEQIEASMSLSKLNLDSLSAIEIRKWISRELEASLQLLEILTSASVLELAMTVLGKSRLVTEKRREEWKLN